MRRCSVVAPRRSSFELGSLVFFSFSFPFDLSPARFCSVLVYNCYCSDVLCVCVHWCCWWWGVVCFRMSFSYNNRPISRVRLWPHIFGHLQNYSRLLLLFRIWWFVRLEWLKKIIIYYCEFRYRLNSEELP